MAAEDGQTGNDVIPRLHIAHLGAHGCHDASGFVAEHNGGRTGVEALLEVHVTVADARRGRPYTDFVRSWGTNIYIFNSQWLMYSAKNCGFHRFILLLWMMGYP